MKPTALQLATFVTGFALFLSALCWWVQGLNWYTQCLEAHTTIWVVERTGLPPVYAQNAALRASQLKCGG